MFRHARLRVSRTYKRIDERLYARARPTQSRNNREGFQAQSSLQLCNVSRKDLCLHLVEAELTLFFLIQDSCDSEFFQMVGHCGL